ncbi:hypothetical protein AQUCO_01300557v1 [Aquilegia coerulea]|uniref:Uncharacterized protein n=1 Tax=Aquilegia coerulea TaxID=218851 RepID=A0A2G5E2G7_AQUCA|nr:hypothetical protein AQUCO_01300557v1 [Aquilegia coerulea]
MVPHAFANRRASIELFSSCQKKTTFVNITISTVRIKTPRLLIQQQSNIEKLVHSTFIHYYFDLRFTHTG